MEKIGIIAEFNPFHKGHDYLLGTAHDIFPQAAVIVAMSGDFTQTGEAAIVSKHSRAKMAVQNGADLVIEIPVCGCTASAREFARTGVALLKKAGVKTLVFACEDPDKELIMLCASTLNKEDDTYTFTLKNALKAGDSFPVARAKALTKSLSSDNEAEYDLSKISDFLSKSNNILAVEYARAVLYFDNNMDIYPIERKESIHNDSEAAVTSEGIVSAAAIRTYIEEAVIPDHDEKTDRIKAADMLQNVMPVTASNMMTEDLSENEFVFTKDFDLLLHAALLANDDYTVFDDCNESLSNKIKNEVNNYRSISSFADSLKSKDITRTHIMRVLIHILLGIKADDTKALRSLSYAPYMRILASTGKGKELLSSIKENAGILLFMSPGEIKRDENNAWDIPDEVSRLLSLDIRSSDLHRAAMTARCHHSIPNEFTRKTE
ncbi:MAG: nucleotidyltransferase family protein [Lachnospiraceae bacterium]|nr:nucleotidyltransferase family protein [Lachnospiraceae bacterium]